MSGGQPVSNPTTGLDEEMGVALHLAAAAVRGLLAFVKGDDLGSSFSEGERRGAAVAVGEAFLIEYKKIDALLEEDRNEQG